MAQTIGDPKTGVIASSIQASPSQGGIDGGWASLRYLITLITAFPVILALIKDRDLVALHAYFTSSDGALVLTAIVAIGTPLYGIARTWWRGRQLAAVAVDPRVPNNVAEAK